MADTKLSGLTALTDLADADLLYVSDESEAAPADRSKKITYSSLKTELTTDLAFEPANANIQSHISNTSNPHSVTKSQISLGSVDNVQQLPLSYLDTDTTLAANSDTKVASQKATKAYADTKQAALGFTPVNKAGDTMTGDLTVPNLNLPTTGASTGAIQENSITALHFYGTDNNFVGKRSGNRTLTGARNNVLGGHSGEKLTSGSDNVFIGEYAGEEQLTGSQCIFIGYAAGDANNGLNGLTCVGYESLKNWNSTAANARHTAFGHRALRGSATVSNNTGVQNSAFGYGVMQSVTSGTSNSIFGYNSAVSLTTGSQNTTMGAIVGGLCTTGSDNTLIGYACGNSNDTLNTLTGVGSSALRYWNSSASTPRHTAVGFQALQGSSTASNNTGIQSTAIGYQALTAITTGSNNAALGHMSGSSITTGSNNVLLGSASSVSATVSNCIAIGYNSSATAANQLVVGALGGGSVLTGHFGQGVTAVSPPGFMLRSTGGSGTNNAGGPLSIAAGPSTGNATPSVLDLRGAAVGASGATEQTISTVLQITNSLLMTVTDAVNIAVGTTTGTKFGTATSQKIGFWNTTPVVQPTTGITAATFVTNTSGIVNDTATFDGYTIGQIVKALRNIGLLT